MLPNVRNMFSDFDDVFSPAFNDFVGFSNLPKVDIKDSGTAFELVADMPGYTKEDVVVEYKNDYLTITANRESNKEEKKENEHYVTRERSIVSFNRSIYLPNVDEDRITGEIKNGVLKMELPKTDEAKTDAKRISLN